MKGYTAHVTEEELAALVDVEGAPPESRKRAEATLAFLVDIAIKNPIDVQPLLEARASGDPIATELAAVDYGVQFGMRARSFHVDVRDAQKAAAGLVGSRAEKDRLAAMDREREQALIDKCRRRGLEDGRLAKHVRKVLLRVQRRYDEPRYVPSVKTILNRISASK
jgi:hypothetical protein